VPLVTLGESGLDVADGFSRVYSRVVGEGAALDADGGSSSAYDAFLSYAHSDAELVEVVQRTLRVLGKPWYRRAALRVFSDQTGLSANPGLWASITAALDRSEWFVLLASPAAASSPWVDAEIKYWLEHRDRSRLLAVVTEGDWTWSRERDDFDVEGSTAVPAALLGVFDEEPRHIDLRWTRHEAELSPRVPRLRDQVAEIAAPMHGLSKEDLIGDDLRQHRRTRRTARAAVAALVALLLVATVAAVDAVHNAHRAQVNEGRARRARVESDFQRLVAQARDLRRSRVDLALLLAVEARHERDVPETRGAIQAALLEDSRYLGPIVDNRTSTGLSELCVTADGHTAVDGGLDGTWGLVDLRSSAAIGPRRRLESPVPSGGSFVGCATDRAAREGVLYTTNGRVWTLSDRSLAADAPVDLHHWINNVAVSPDGRWIAAATLDGTVEVWARGSPDKRRRLATAGATDAQAVAFSPDARLLASTTDSEIVLRDTNTWNVVRRIADAPDAQAGALVQLLENGRSLVFSPDGTTLVNSRRAVIRVINLATGSVRWESHNNLISGAAVAFASDSSSLFIDDDTALVQQLDARTGVAVDAPIHPPSEGETLAVAPDGKTLLLTSDVDGEIWRWALDDRSPISSFIPAPGRRVFNASPDGRLLSVVTTGSQVVTDGVIEDRSTRRVVYRFPLAAYPTLLEHQELRAFFVSDLAVDGVDLRSGHRVKPHFPVPIAGVSDATVSTSGDVLVGYEDGSVRLFRPDGRQIGDPWMRVRGSPRVLAFSPRRDLVAITAGDTITLYRTNDASKVHVVNGFDGQFNRDGSVFGFFADDDNLRLLDTRTLRLIGVATNDRTYSYPDLQSPNVFVLKTRARAQLFDWNTIRPIGEPFPSVDVPVLFRDGKTLATNTPRGIVLWNLDPAHWEGAACAVAGRNLTRAEWRTYFPSEPKPRSTCPQWPAPA
jgi:WD40 repeat protein